MRRGPVPVRRWRLCPTAEAADAADDPTPPQGTKAEGQQGERRGFGDRGSYDDDTGAGVRLEFDIRTTLSVDRPDVAWRAVPERVHVRRHAGEGRIGRTVE